MDGATVASAISAPVPSSRWQSFVPATNKRRRRRLCVPASSVRARSPQPIAHRPRLRSRALAQRRSSTGCCRLAASLRANPWSVGGWIVLRAINSLVHWCCSCPGQGRAANPWWLRRPGSSDFQRASWHSDCPNSRGPAPHLRYAPQHSPLPVSASNTFLGLCQPQDPFNWPACSH